MALQLGNAPPNGVSVVRNALAKLDQASPHRAMSGGTPASANIHDPQEVFTLDLDALADGQGLTAARPCGWRYLVSNGNDLVESVSVRPGSGGAAAQFSGVNQGALVASVGKALIVGENLPAVSQCDFEVRLLQIPGIYVNAVWLRDLSGDGNDILIPYSASPPLADLQPYESGDFITIVAPLASERLRHSDEPTTQTPSLSRH